MKPREEVKSTLHHRLEKHGALQHEIDSYMSFLDEQMDVMILNPTSEKQFLGNTYKWWASFLSAEEAAMPLNQQALPICLIHGIEDGQIPVLSADLAAESLAKKNALTYYRLEGYGHDLNTANVQDVASRWLSSVLFGQEASNDIFAVQAVLPAAILSEDWKTDISHCVLSRGTGKVYVETQAQKDTDGNKSASGSVGVSKEFDNGFKVDVRGEASVRQDNGRDAKGEVKIEGRASKEF